jgi:hypothetical protein
MKDERDFLSLYSWICAPASKAHIQNLSQRKVLSVGHISRLSRAAVTIYGQIQLLTVKQRL